MQPMNPTHSEAVERTDRTRLFWRKPLQVLVDGIVRLMRQGLTRRRLSIGLALGATVAIFPVFFLPALACLALAALAGLNQPIMQAINYIAGPVQILLFLPFMRIGEYVFGLQRYTLDIATLRHILTQEPSSVLAHLRVPIGHAMLGWLVMAPIVFILGYCLLYRVLWKLPMPAGMGTERIQAKPYA